MKKVLLIGIGGVYNYGCEAIVRGTVNILRSQWPDIRIVYASKRPEDDRRRLIGCDIEIVKRKMLGRYSLKNITRKLLSFLNIVWYPTLDSPGQAEGYDAVFSIGGDIYTLYPNGNYNINLPKFGNYIESRGIPYILWGASVGPFERNPEAKKLFTEHLKKISLITARECSTIDYLKSLGIKDNVIPCADPAYAVAPDIRADNFQNLGRITIGINLSPLSAIHTNISVETHIKHQAVLIENLISSYDAEIILIPHVVCDHDVLDDDLRYLKRVKEAISPEYLDRISLIDTDPGFIGTKNIIIKCDLIIAARMHCAINALSAHVPTILLAYSNKAFGMCGYIYGSSEWVIDLNDPDSRKNTIQKTGSMLERNKEIRNFISTRFSEIKKDVFNPIQELKSRILE